MSTLHVRSVPDELYQYIQSLAQKSNRSLTAQVISMLNQAAEEEKRREKQKQTLYAIKNRRFQVAEDAPTSLELLRDDRSR
ncbi:MAG: hypothetical protein ISR59_08250 [Anaerolineales bacterium]|uniref:CopG-like ribbon-helix-helix domain-containing protein n=1 Tax=Candidatus Desulfolinea nitratireducens TaxID=2841698 RepID=A0A8J6NJT2_9CHLR|nr:hypothetical protein [Candidatus Desulfolinea nitratireducens]MBL6961089.1 hypothetical protein [Anaerolineales bacterium]